MENPVSLVGYRSLQFVQHLGRMAAFTAAVGRAAVTPPIRGALCWRELHKLGVLSLIIIIVCGVAVGMVAGLQGYHALVRFGADRSLGAVVGIALFRELGPVVTALLVTGRAGSAATAEIGTMIATEQLDGLRMQSIDPVHFVITPKALAMMVALPLLTALFVVFGLFGGYMVDVVFMAGDPGSYMASLRSSVDFHNDVVGCFLKSLVFGVLIGLIATFRGYTSRPTSEGVSAATTSTVVIGSVTVLLVDYAFTALWGA